MNDLEQLTLWKQGAEARLYRSQFYGQPVVIKERFPKSYRHPTLDKSLTSQRTKSEVRTMMRCRLNGECVMVVGSVCVVYSMKNAFILVITPFFSVQINLDGFFCLQ